MRKPQQSERRYQYCYTGKQADQYRRLLFSLIEFVVVVADKMVLKSFIGRKFLHHFLCGSNSSLCIARGCFYVSTKPKLPVFDDHRTYLFVQACVVEILYNTNYHTGITLVNKALPDIWLVQVG